ncbi:putative uncharacterized protein DDB_G0290521 isoform X4 [Epinephelus moara]|uniref:putative uncharacterized protein DDB_G0290521 isoform X4 n=1 Tax=Epinephelus moara TaxID=300413 RepID=UPI00214F4FB5|nr:putative uncharacterized protein DDB_G0290521 isoform X4 [Epinephelus moara]
MSQRKTTRVIKKRIYPDCVEGPNFPSPPKRFQKGSNTTASKGPVPQQPSTALVQNIPKTTTTTKDNLYSMDLFASEKPERSIDLPESPTEQPESSIEQPESSMEMSKSWHPPADDVDDDDDDNITQLSSVSSATLKTVLTAPKYTSTPVNTGGKTPRVRTAARTPEGCDRRSPIHTPVRTPQETPSPESKRRASVSKTVRTPQGNRGGSQRPKNPSIPARKRVYDYPMMEKISEGSCGDPNGHPG